VKYAHWYLLIIALVLFWISGWADYELQAFQHGWHGTGLIDMAARAPKWGWLDWIPHDGWHLVQTTLNTSLLIASSASVLFGVAVVSFLEEKIKMLRSVVAWYIAPLLAVFAFHALMRGASFSILYRLLN
jgi:hypothetical protein